MPQSRPDRSAAGDPEALRSTAWLRVFRWILTRQLRSSFHAVRLALPGVPVIADELPLIVYCNHPSWWDGALLPVVLDRLFPGRRIFGPIDAAALQRYRFMRRLGFFGVTSDSYVGAARFLRIGRRLLARPDTLFCLTPEGRFSDPRERPIRLRPGLAGLIAGVPRVTTLPLAVEYPFWDERLPEALVRFGEARVVGTASPMASIDLATDLEDRLTDALDRLRDDALGRDEGRFTALLDGRVGIGGLYDVGRRIAAWSHGRRFDAAHVPRRSIDEG